MGLTVYLDVLLCLNFAVDLLLLLTSAMLTGAPLHRGRIIGAAALGAFYGAGAAAPGFHFLSSRLWQAVVWLLMMGLAYGFDASGRRRWLAYLWMSLTLGGSAALMAQRGSVGFGGLALMAGALYLTGRLYLAGAGARRLQPVRIRLGCRQVELTALADTGNSLRDPLTGQPVLVAQRQAAEELLHQPVPVRLLEDPAQAMRTLSEACPDCRFRLIPYRTVGTGQGLLLALRCDSVEIGGRQAGPLVAFSPVELSARGEYAALTGGA